MFPDSSYLDTCFIEPVSDACMTSGTTDFNNFNILLFSSVHRALFAFIGRSAVSIHTVCRLSR